MRRVVVADGGGIDGSAVNKGDVEEERGKKEERGCIWSTRGESNFAVEEEALTLTDTLCRRVVAL